MTLQTKLAKFIGTILLSDERILSSETANRISKEILEYGIVVAENQWLPIESAPKKFMEEILVYDKDWCFKTPFIACWDDINECWINPDREEDHEVHPSHWQPLSKIPRGESK